MAQLPPLVHAAVYVTAALVIAGAIVGVWLIWRDRRRLRLLTHATQRLENTNESLSDTAGRLGRLVHDLREALNQLRWGRGPQS